MLDVLIIAPHPDDAELGMGGTILRFKDKGLRVGVLDLTTGEPTPHGSPEQRRAETAAATKLLNLDWRENLGLANRSLQPTLEARWQVAAALRQHQARWLFAPYWVDAHPDHHAATQLVEDARFWAKLSKSDLPGERYYPQRVFYYYCIHLKQAFVPTFVCDISPYYRQKRAILECYHSQFVEGRSQEPPSLLDALQNEDAHWGHLIGTRYAEPFALREPLGVTSFASFV